MQRWQNKTRRLKQFLRGWAKNMNGAYKKEKQELLRKAEELDKKAESTSRDVVINDVTLTSLKTPEWSQLVFCDDFVTILFWSLWWRHICSSVTKLVFPS
jgi:hypothetical protein